MIRTFISGIVIAVAQLAVHTGAIAAEPSTRSLERLLEVTKAEKLTEQVRAQVAGMMKPMFDQAIGSRNLSPEQRQHAERMMVVFTARMEKVLAEELSWSSMKDLTLQIYRESFTQEEIDGLIVFYESPAGQAFISKMPVVTQKTMAAVQQRMGPMMQRMQMAAREAAMEMRSR